MQALIYCNWFSRITGSLIDIFEYYIAILEHNPDIKLIFINLYDKSIDPLIKAFENRYNISNLNYIDNISCIYKRDLIHMSFDKVLVLDYGTIQQTKGLINSKEIIVISELFTDDPKYMYDKNLNNVTYYGEMPFVYKNVNYKMKFLFDRFKKLTKTKSGYYINSPGNNDHSFVNDLRLNRKRPIYHKQNDHVNNFFELFDCYIYYHANTYFDPHPRLLLECAFYKKEIKYLNPYDVRDGSYYRYNDLMVNGLKDRFLNKDDDIVRRFI